MRLGDYEVHQAWEGFASIRQISSGEIMHSRTAPMEEARQLYVEQSNLAERLLEKFRGAGPLVIWDVGLGAAANAMASIECYASVRDPRPLTIISFENDLDSLSLALRQQDRFPYLEVLAIEAILTEGEWESADYPGLRWHLWAGDFLETMNGAPPPDVVFYDMFSTRTARDLWTTGTFRKLFGVCRRRAVELFTYTCSTANRAALLAAGFYVARGGPAGEKVETTIALTPAVYKSSVGRKRDLLAEDWLARWNRSASRFPADIADAERTAFKKIIQGHEQFGKSPAAERLLSTTMISP